MAMKLNPSIKLPNSDEPSEDSLRDKVVELEQKLAELEEKLNEEGGGTSGHESITN